MATALFSISPGRPQGVASGVQPLSRRFWSRYCLCGLGLWIVLLGAFAVYTLVIPHGPNFAVPLGPQGAFVAFGGAGSIGYAFLLLAVAATVRLVRRLWSAAPGGAR